MTAEWHNGDERSSRQHSKSYWWRTDIYKWNSYRNRSQTDKGKVVPLLTYSMVQSSSWEANWFAASQEIPRISRNPKVHYRTHKRPPPVISWASPIQSIYPHPTSWRSVLILPTHLYLGLPSGLLPSGFPSKTLYTPSPHPYAPHAQPISFFSILFPTQYWVRSTNHLALRYAISSIPPLPRPSILLNTMFSNTLSFLCSRNVNDQVSHICPVTRLKDIRGSRGITPLTLDASTLRGLVSFTLRPLCLRYPLNKLDGLPNRQRRLGEELLDTLLS